jgi:BirA family transcriptional regulator, biotin operon repressor / biotin---[acetyl-CoA-carboxylase] ligase
MYTAQALRQGLKTQRFGHKIYTFDTIDSTNNCARALAACWADEGTVIIAEQQTAGKGRLGRVWQANPNENLTFSIILRPSANPEQVNLLPLYVAVAVAQAIERSTSLKVECKWPNDLLINGKKVAGILLEGAVKENTLEYVVVGIGVNVNQAMFARELEGKATSLRLENGKDVDRLVLFREILRSLENNYKALSSSGFNTVLPLWLARSSMINRQISVSERGSVISGVVRGLSPEGGLILDSPQGAKTLFAGDVTILGIETPAA